MPLQDPGGLSSLNLTFEGRGDYIDSVDPTKLLDDPRFHQDLREYYATQGKRFDNTDDMIREWYDDRTFAELNMTVGTAGDIADTYSASPEQRELKKRLTAAYHKTPFFWQEGGMGQRDPGQVARSIGWALATDPLTYVGPARAVPAAGKAMAAAAKAGKSTTRAGFVQGAKTGAMTEAAVAAPITAAGDALIQARDMQLGLQDDYSFGQTAAAAGLGMGLGGTVGGVVGGVSGSLAGRTVARKLQTDELSRTFEQRPGDFAAPIDQIGDDLEANAALIETEQGRTQELIDAENAAVGEANARDAGIEPERPGMKSEDVDLEAAYDNLRTAEEDLQVAHRDGLDSETIDELRTNYNDAANVASLAERIKRSAAEIQALRESNIESDQIKARQRDDELQRVIGIYRRLTEGQEVTNPADIQRANQILDGDYQDVTPRQAEMGQLEDQSALALPDKGAETAPNAKEKAADQSPAQATPRAALGEGQTIQTTPEGEARVIKPLEEVNFERNVEIEGTGEIKKVYENAAKKYEQITNRFDSLHMLRKCVGA